MGNYLSAGYDNVREFYFTEGEPSKPETRRSTAVAAASGTATTTGSSVPGNLTGFYFHFC
jgi:hypothetical protein